MSEGKTLTANRLVIPSITHTRAAKQEADVILYVASSLIGQLESMVGSDNVFDCKVSRRLVVGVSWLTI